MLILVLFLITLCLGLITLYKYLKLRSVEQENTLIESYMDSMKQLYTVLSHRAEAVQKYRHDLANHIRTLQTLSTNPEDLTAVTKYMEGLSEQYNKLQSERYCSNDMINSVLTLKKDRCVREQIPLKLEIEDLNNTNISDFDMVSFLHNILDNAIEANERIPQNATRGITFQMGLDSKFLWMVSENYVAPHTDISFKTQKNDKQNHGFGTKIIDSIIKQYHGQKELSLDQENYILTQKFQFPVSAAIKEN